MRGFNDWYFDLFESGNGACLNQQEIAEEAWQHQQSKIDELQKRVDAALKETLNALQYVEGDMRGNHEFLKMAMIRTFKDLEQTLKGGEA